MSLLWLILALALVGFALWAVNAYVPMPPAYKQMLNAVVIICVVFWVVYWLMAAAPPGPPARPFP